MIGEPPSETGGRQLTTAVVTSAVAAMMLGGSGRASSLGGAERLLAGPAPAALRAATVKVQVSFADVSFSVALVVEASTDVDLAFVPLR